MPLQTMKPFKLFLLAALLAPVTFCAPFSPASAQEEAADPDEAPKPPAEELEAEAETAPAALPTGAIAGAYEPTAVERNSKVVAPLKLAENGKVLMPIVIAQKAGPETRRAATELVEILNKIVGVKSEIKTSDGAIYNYEPYTGPRKGSKQVFAERKALEEKDAANALKPAEVLPASGIVLGTADEFQMPAEIKPGLAMRGVYHGREAFAIRTQPKRLLILAGEARGLVQAVNRLLHEMGCRWFATGENWEIIPKNPNLTFNLDITDRPSIGTRIIAFMDGVNSHEERRDQGEWSRRNSIGSSFGTSTGHIWHRIAEENEAELLAHPEYFALVGGERRVPTYTGKDGKKHINGVFAKFEMGNKRVREMFVNFALGHFRRNPESNMVSLSPTDGGGFSQSEESRALGDGSVSDAVYTMVNEVARAVKKEFPGKMVGCYAYRETAGPPSFPLEDNVYIEVATLFNMSQYSSAELLKLWPQRTKHMGVYRYFSYYDAGGSGIPGGPISNIKGTTDTIRGDYARNTSAIFAQSSNAFAMQMRGYLVATRLMWNPNADVEAILADFYEKSYGPASAPMKRFHERVAGGAKHAVNDFVLGAAHRDVDEATKLAQNRPDVLKRLGDLKLYLRYVHLSRTLGDIPRKTPQEKVAFKAAYVKMMHVVVQMAPTYMAQTNMISKNSGRGWAASLKDVTYIPKWQRGNRYFKNIPGDKDAPNLGADAPPATPESIEAGFQESLKALPDKEIPYRDFDLSDLVPVEFPPAPALNFPPKAGTDPATLLKRSEYYQGRSPLYYFYSFKGEPIELELAGGARYKSGKAAWSLSQFDAKGQRKIVAQGEIPADKSLNKVSIKVPSKGLYGFNFAPGTPAGTMIYSLEKPVTITATGAKDFRGGFIYVPKGTKEIWMDFNHQNGGSQNLLQPDGKVAQNLVAGTYSIAVPPGMDGQLWRFGPRNRFRTQTFHNIPNLAAPSPETLMVPREIAEKDALKIRSQ